MWLVLAEAFALCLIGALSGMLLASAITLVLPPEFPVATDLQVWAIAGASVVVLTLMVGLPPALTAQRLKIVDALAGRGDDSPLERLLHRGLRALSRLLGHDDQAEAQTT
jgi:putative ABC transport system permease protein